MDICRSKFVLEAIRFNDWGGGLRMSTQASSRVQVMEDDTMVIKIQDTNTITLSHGGTNHQISR